MSTFLERLAWAGIALAAAGILSGMAGSILYGDVRMSWGAFAVLAGLVVGGCCLTIGAMLANEHQQRGRRTGR